MKDKRRGTAQGWKPGGKVPPKKKAGSAKANEVSKGKGQMNEGEPRWSGDPKPAP